jgi:hypothetical protein
MQPSFAMPSAAAQNHADRTFNRITNESSQYMRIERVHVGESAQAVIGNVQPGSKVGANQAIIEPEDARPLKRSGSLARSQLRGEVRSYF